MESDRETKEQDFDVLASAVDALLGNGATSRDGLKPETDYAIGLGVPTDRGGLARLSALRREKHVMSVIKEVPSRYKLNVDGATERQREAAGRMYRAVVSRNAQAYGPIHLSWLSKLADAKSVCSVMRRIEENQDRSVLDVSGSPDVSESDLAQLFAVTTNARDIILRRCLHVNDTVLEALAKHCAGVSSINLREVTSFTDNGLAHLGAKCEQLDSIVLNRCTEVRHSRPSHFNI